MYREVFFITCVFAGVLSIQRFNITPCRTGDKVCYTRTSEQLYAMSMAGDPSLKIDSLDPIYHKQIDGKFAIVDYKMYNSSVEGLSNCHVAQSELSLQKSTLVFELSCPYILMTGQYDISGILIVVPIEGSGDFALKCKNYHILVESDITVNQGKDGHRHVRIKNFKATGDLRDALNIHLTNLFNGQNKELADAALTFANTYWRPVAREFQGPVITANVKRIIKNLNKYLKLISLESMVFN
ncbi:circadian clock-controlled protein daywake-like [Anticarsia gemmatalis]|uniref:circadian clock-controlled protein daywake-like n=1 Tax=Anticarsia gemmatalis TaxID=129554 RepID=UPI003F760FC0